MPDKDPVYKMPDLLNLMVDSGAADLHVRTGIPPAYRDGGTLKRVEGPDCEPDDVEYLVKAIASDDQIQMLRTQGGADFGFAFGTKARFRVSAFKERGNMALVLRQIPNDLLQWAYDRYSFNVIPKMGKMIANDADSYQYLVESIRKFPDQETFLGMVKSAGFENAKYRNLTMGIACLHSGWKI